MAQVTERERKLALQMEGERSGVIAQLLADEGERVRREYHADVIQADLAEMLTIVGLGPHARPKSPHQVVHEELIPRLREMVEAIAWTPDR